MPMSGIGDVVGVVLFLTIIASVAHAQSSYVCPRKFTPIGKKCYHFSKDEATWNDAHFQCSKLNSTLATITGPHQESLVRRYMNRRNQGRYERWLGGKFNEKKLNWIWAHNGKPLTFHGFSRMNASDRQWAWHCIVVDPELKWGARNCLHQKHYICLRKGSKKKIFNRNKCNNNSKLTPTEEEICSRQKLGNSAPGRLVRQKRKKGKPYKPATFVCPSHMILVGRKCYYFSLKEASWSDAHWACRDNKTKLANILTKMEDNILRGFLNENFTEKHERWIGGIYDWKQMKWKWAISGKVIKYTHFAREAVANKNHTHHCITLDPQYGHMWNSQNRLEKKHFICQAKSKSVVLYEKPLNPDATVIIQFDNNNVVQEKSMQISSTSASPLHNKHTATDKFVYN